MSEKKSAPLKPTRQRTRRGTSTRYPGFNLSPAGVAAREHLLALAEAEGWSKPGPSGVLERMLVEGALSRGWEPGPLIEDGLVQESMERLLDEAVTALGLQSTTSDRE